MAARSTMLGIASERSLEMLKRVVERAEKAGDPWRAARKALDEALDERGRVAVEIQTAYSGQALLDRLKAARSHLEAVHRWVCRAWPNTGGVAAVKARLVEGSRLLVGGSTGVLQAVFEVGLAWDHVLDLPYIPGSSLKGAMRASAEALLGDEYKSVVEAVFGSRSSSGCIEVFDAYPVEAPGNLLDLDVVTPHYYKGGEVKESELEAQPVPVVHLSVAPGVAFHFIVAHRCPESVLRGLSTAFHNKLRIKASGPGAVAALLIVALFSGVGARTGKGYGVFRVEDFSFGCPGGGPGGR